MLVLFLFNIGGYQLLFNYFIYQSDNSIAENINANHYRASDLVEVKIPVHLTIENWDGFKPISGQIKANGTCYNYAEIKMTSDTLFLKCIPNQNKAGLLKANNTFAKEINDVPQSKKEHNPSVKKSNSLSEYNLQAFLYSYNAQATSLTQNNRSAVLTLARPYIDSPGKPPNFIA